MRAATPALFCFPCAWNIFFPSSHFQSICVLRSEVGCLSVQFSSVQSLSHVQLFAIPWITACQASLSITTPGVHSNSCPSSWWCHPAMSSCVIPFSLAPNQSLFQWVNSLHKVAKVLEFQLQHQSFQGTPRTWFPLGWTGWISLQSKGLSRVFSNTTVQKHQFFSTQLSSQSNSQIPTWPLEKPQPWLDGPLVAK